MGHRLKERIGGKTKDLHILYRWRQTREPAADGPDRLHCPRTPYSPDHERHCYNHNHVVQKSNEISTQKVFFFFQQSF